MRSDRPQSTTSSANLIDFSLFEGTRGATLAGEPEEVDRLVPSRRQLARERVCRHDVPARAVERGADRGQKPGAIERDDAHPEHGRIPRVHRADVGRGTAAVRGDRRVAGNHDSAEFPRITLR